MLADLAHEMRTPLATIDAHLEAVEDGVRVLDDDTLGVIRGSTGRLRRLAEDMTAVSRAEEGLDVTLRPVAAADAGRGGRRGRPRPVRRQGGAPAHASSPTPARSASTPTGSDRCSATCSTTPCATLPTGGTVTLACRRDRPLGRVPRRRHRRGRGGRAPAAPVRPVLPRRHRPRPRPRRLGHRAGDRQGARRGTRRWHLGDQRRARASGRRSRCAFPASGRLGSARD